MDAAEFQDHRERLLKVFHDNEIKEGVIVFSSPQNEMEKYTNSEFKFLQESMFYWISGWSNPGSVITINIEDGHSTLYIPQYDDSHQIWVGPIPTSESIIQKTAVNEVKFENQVAEDLANYPIIFRDADQFTDLTEADCRTFLVAASIARAVKSPKEIECLKRASDATGKAIVAVMKEIDTAQYEYDVEAMFAYHGARAGGRFLSFTTIVASGKNAAYLHYVENSSPLKKGNLLLLDCGVYIDHYAGDVTRTFPVSGKFSPDQKRVYQLLLDLQKDLITKSVVGETIGHLNELMHQGIFEILKKLEIIPQDLEFSRNISRLFCPHGLSHHLGMNTHDVVFYKHEDSKIPLKDTSLTEDMIITIEPGIYFHEVRFREQRSNPDYEIVDFDKAFHLADAVGGIRIEDDIRVTPNGGELLAIIPKDVDEIEAIMSKRQ